MNRNIDTDVTTSGQRLSADYYLSTGSPTGYSFSSSISGAFRSVHKRIGAGGRFNSNTQKAYLRKSYLLNQYSGELYQKNTSTYTLHTGVVSGAYNMSGNALNLNAEQFYRGSSSNAAYQNSATPGVNPDLLSQAEVKALNGLRGKSGESAVNLGLWYGERHETAQMFRDTAEGLFKLAQAIRSHDLKTAVSVLRDDFRTLTSNANAYKEAKEFGELLRRARKAANSTLKGMENAVLGYNLGLSPLLQDLQDAHQRLQTGDLTVKCAVKSVGKYQRLTQDQDVYSMPSGHVRSSTYSELHGYTVTLVAVPAWDELARLSRWGLTNPASLGYQLTSLSFLLDYVYSLGPYLSALDVPASFVFQAGSWSQRVSRVITGEVKSPLNKVARGSSVLNFHERKLYTSFPVPIPPLSLRQRELSYRQAVNTGLIATKKLRKLLGVDFI